MEEHSAIVLRFDMCMIVCQQEVENYSKYEKGAWRHLLYGCALSVLSASICSDFDMHSEALCVCDIWDAAL